MSPILRLIGVLGTGLLIFFASAMETALYRVSRARLRLRAEKGDSRARALLRVLDGVNDMVTVILVNNNLASYLGAYLLTVQLAHWAVPQAELTATLILTPAFFVFAESLPKQLAYNHADRLAGELVRIFRSLEILFFPLVKTLNLLSEGLRRLCGSPGRTDLSPSRRALLLEHLDAGVADNILSGEQNRMAGRIIRLEGISAGDCMIPLRRLCLIPAGASRSQALAALARSRELPALLVDPGGRPTGRAVSLKDLILTPGGPDEPVLPAARQLERLRSGQPVPEALRLFHSRRIQLALVMENNRPAGLITDRGILGRIAGI
ncbi:MAG: CNNM domain-containing protein [Planctomycetota bacterium]|jgi:CBS domain containing-hemolysin-like protein|nr:CNNM domain-containing protein [Planctomycetota bacterium]